MTELPVDHQGDTSTAAEHCNLEIVQLIHDRYPPMFYSGVLSDAAASGRLDAVEWIYHTAKRSSREPADLKEDRRYGYNYEAALSRAARNDH